jgi:hypothetical protein
MSDWLPSLIRYADFGGDWNKFIEEVYSKFKLDFLDDFNRRNLKFEGVPLNLRRHPLVRGKEASFWHLVSTGDIEEERLPDFDRCERIAWAKAILDNANDSAIKRWENTRGSNRNICLWLEDENYMVVLGKRNGYLLLLTAYCVENYRRKKLNREYEEYISSLKS